MLRLCSVRCPHMNEITLEDTLEALRQERYQIEVPRDVAERARVALARGFAHLSLEAPDAFGKALSEALSEQGHTLKPLQRGYGNMQAIFWDHGGGRVEAASDPRGAGTALVR